uniref:Zn(2)-C6 fungal-type domain-containing protein n=1 Tax=Fusarium oxysporum (strain Fo5176) TaxID=660025 RepID=A0A0D2XI30_FUSOF
MENQPKRAGLGRTSCTECRRRKVKCVYDDDQAECQQCNRHSLTCQPQNAESSLEERDEIIQGFSQFAGQVETRMIPTKHTVEVMQATGTPQSRLTASLKGLLPDKPVLSRILEHSSKFTQNWMSWPLATVSYQQQDNDFLPVKTVTLFDAGFPKDVESAFKFVDKSMSSSYQKPPNPGVVAKCIVWLCLSIKELPQRFKYSDNRAPPPFEPRFLIDNCIAKVEALYQVSSAPVCNIDFVQALILQGELFLSIGRPTKAWKCIRTGIENAMLLGVHQGRSSLDRGIWEELWIRDRQLSLFLGMSHAVPVQLGLKMAEEEYPVAEKEAFRQIATVSGLLTSRNLMKEDTPSATITRTLQEMRELKAMIPEHWTKGHPRYVSYLPQAFTRAYIKILYHTFELMLNWPKCQPSNVDPQQVNDFEPSRKAILEATQEIIKAHEAMRAPEVEPNAVMRADFVDFLAFKAALVMVAVIKDKKNPMPLASLSRFCFAQAKGTISGVERMK